MFHILTVCTGNICRSPLAESLLRQDLPSSAFSVGSAGVMAVPGGQVPRPQLRIGKSVGISDLEHHRARPVTPALLHQTDLVLGMSRTHRKLVVRMDPGAVRKTFTLREFAHLAAHVTPDDVEECIVQGMQPLAAAVEAVARKRGMVPSLGSPDQLDVVDPFGKARAWYKASRDQLVPAADTAAAYLNGILQIFGETAQVQQVTIPQTPVQGTPSPNVLRKAPMAAVHRNKMTEPDIISQGIPQIPKLPKRAELRRQEARR